MQKAFPWPDFITWWWHVVVFRMAGPLWGKHPFISWFLPSQNAGVRRFCAFLLSLAWTSWWTHCRGADDLRHQIMMLIWNHCNYIYIYIPQKYTRFCCALFCCGCAIWVFSRFQWSIYHTSKYYHVCVFVHVSSSCFTGIGVIAWLSKWPVTKILSSVSYERLVWQLMVDEWCSVYPWITIWPGPPFTNMV